MDLVEYFLEKILAPILVALVVSVIISNKKMEPKDKSSKETVSS